jgi:hypothetical protein
VAYATGVTSEQMIEMNAEMAFCILMNITNRLARTLLGPFLGLYL